MPALSTQLQGDLLSIGSSLLWALAVICFRLGGNGMPVFQQNFFKNLVGAALFCATLPLAGQTFLPPAASGTDWLLIAFSGVGGMAVADLFFFRSLQLLGATLSAIASALYCPAMMLFSALLLGDRAGPGILAGGLLVVSAIVVGAREPGSRDSSNPPRHLLKGVACATVYILLVVLSIVPIKPLMNRLDPAGILWVAWARLLFGTLGMVAMAPFQPRGFRQLAAAFRPTAAAGWMLLGAAVGAWLVPIAWLLGLKLIDLSRASVLNELFLVFVFVLSALLLREPFTRRRALAVAMAFGGTVVVLTS